MSLARTLAVVLFLMFNSPVAHCADNALLIQMVPGDSYRIWHTEGVTQLSEEEVMAVASTATPEGGPLQQVSVGQARAFQTENGIVIELPEARHDARLLIDRDACGAIKVWHAEGQTQLSEEQMTDLILAALPEGGKLVKLDERYAKSFITPLGYAVVIWRPIKRQ